MSKKPSVYLASTLSNWRRVQQIGRKLAEFGIGITHDWTVWGQEIENGISDLSPDALRKKAYLEVQGVLNADAVAAIMPGGRGTHFELGLAYGMTMIGPDPTPLPLFILSDGDDGIPTSFHHLPCFEQFTSEDELVKTIAHRLLL